MWSRRQPSTSKMTLILTLDLALFRLSDMMGMEVPGTAPWGEHLYRCNAPGCTHTAMATYPPKCPLHEIPMDEVPEEGPSEEPWKG
jgi:hypothetical protein